MQARQTRIVNLLEFLQSHKQEFTNVKIHNRSVNSYDVVTQQEVLIEPFYMTNISCTMASDCKPLPIKTSEGSVLFKVTAVNVTGLRHMRNTLLAYTEITALSIPLYNDTNDYISIPRNTQIAQIEHMDQTLPCYNVQFRTLKSGVITLNNAIPTFIENDDFMNEEEKMSAFIEFTKK
jgi:hypothetical protein